MAKKLLLSLAAVAAFAVAGCSETLEYNSRSGINGSRDAANQLLVNSEHTEDISAPKADNEDWYYFMPPEEGLVTVKAVIDRPQSIVVAIAVRDSFGIPIQTIETNRSENIYTFPQLEVKTERYFISLITTNGESGYTVRVGFEVPPPVVIEPDPEPDPGPTPTPTKCKGSSCKKPPQPDTTPTGGPNPDDPKITGTIVLVTPRGENLCEVKIDGVGKNKGAKAGAKAYLRGLNRKVDIKKCLNTSCTGTIKATSEELSHYDKVDVYID